MAAQDLENELSDILRQDPSLLRALDARLTDGLWYFDTSDPRGVWVSPQFKARLGYQPDEIEDDLHWALSRIEPGDVAALRVHYERHCNEPDYPYDHVVRYRHKNGTHRWMRSRGFVLRDEYGAPRRMIGVYIDVTEMKEAEQALRRSEERLHSMLANMSEGIVVAEVNGAIVSWSRAALEIHGLGSGKEWLQPLSVLADEFDLYTLDGAAVPVSEWPLARIFRGEVLRGQERRVVRKGSTWERVFSYAGSIVEEPSGKRMAFLAITDLTERWRATEALKESEERLRIANDVAGIGTYFRDLVTGTLRFSPKLMEILGHPAGEDVSVEQGFAFVHPDDRSLVLQVLTGRGHAGESTRVEIRVVRADGQMRWLSWSFQTFFRDSPSGPVPARRVGACFDITEMRQAERRLATQNNVSRVLVEAESLVEAGPKIMEAFCESEGWDFGAIWVVDAEANVLRCADVWHRPSLPLGDLSRVSRSLTFARGVGLPGRVWDSGEPLLVDVRTDPNYLRTNVALASGLRGALAFPILHGSEVTGVIDFLGRSPRADAGLSSMFGVIGRQLGAFFEKKRAAAERAKLEAQLRQVQKMDSLGQLSGGIAHDFNNILAAILGNTQLAAEELGPNHPAADLLQEVVKASERARALVRQILTFARRQRHERRVISLSAVVEESLELLRSTLPANVRLSFETESPVGHVLADPIQIQQVVVNLGTNAWHALEGRPGRIDVRLDQTVLSEESARTLGGIPAGNYVRLFVRDTGHGMGPAVLERIFEPFFTTKESGKGTGLGLSVVHGIVQAHDGAIAAKSEPGAGTVFELYLPLAAPSTTRSEPPQSQVAPGLGEHVLFVDDEEPIVRLSERLLTRLGYRVTGFVRAADALAAFREAPERYALVATDHSMPDLSGLDLLTEVRRLRPEMPVILLSGRVEEELEQALARLGVREIVHKPFDATEFAAAIRRALTAPSVPAP